MLARRVDDAALLGAAPRTTLIAIGNFDGVHRGHRAVLEAAVQLAHEHRVAPVVLTFHPHPAEVLGRGRQPVLTPLERKVDLICAVASELRVVTQRFTLALAATPPEEFSRRLLAEQLGARLVIVGQNFRFGRERAGDLASLERAGVELGFEARALPLAGDAQGPFSSSRARAALQAGDLAGVERVLGRPHALTGQVVHGAGRGRTLGVPTANLDAVGEVLPPHGVYAGLVHRLAPSGQLERLGPAVANIGVRPTLGAGLSVEVHLLGRQIELYGQTLRLHLIERLREERKFAGLDALRAQIALDLGVAERACRARLAGDALDAWY